MDECKEKSMVALVSLHKIHNTSQLVTVLPLLLLLLGIEVMLLLLLILLISLLLLPHLVLAKPEVMRIHAPSVYTTISAIYYPSLGHSSGAGDSHRRGQGAYTNDTNYSHDKAREVR